MKDFSEWLAENQQALDVDVYGLFNDSYRCFKNDIDRPAYLLAYQGMMQHVRKTVLQAPSRPAGYLEAEWENNWLKPLRDDGKWDEVAYKCTQTKEDTVAGKAAVMNITNEAREKFPFWRQLRNVCAHYKGYDLHRAHSLALYSFIEQYLMKLTVEGSQVSLNKLFDDYYNPVLTSVHEDVKPLLAKIDSTIRDEEFNAFFVEVRKSCGTHARYTSRFNNFVHEVLSFCPKRVKDAMVVYVQSDDDLRDDYLDDYPDDVLDVLSGADNIHQFWYAKLPHLRKKLTILALMLQADYIPDSDKEDAMKRCMQNAEDYTSCTHYSGIDQTLVDVLTDKGFFDMFYRLYFNPDNTSRNARPICYKTDFYMGMISILSWDKKYVDNLIKVFKEQYYPYTLQSRLQEKYRNEEEYKKAVDKICEEEGWSLPSEIV